MIKELFKNTKIRIKILTSLIILLSLIIGITTYFMTYGDVVSEFENDPDYNQTQIIGNKVIINEIENDYYYFKSLNYTKSEGSLPTTENKNIYNDNNLVQMKITYSSHDEDKIGYVSLDERQDTYIYFKMYEVNNNGTADLTDDYILLELIDNPFTDKPTDKGFNGWYTDYQGVKLSIDMAYYERYAKIPVTYENNKPKKIEIEFHAKWTNAKVVNVESNFNTAIGQLNLAGMKKIETVKIIYEYIDMTGYYYQETFSFYESVPSGYSQSNGQEAPTRCTSWGGCTYYKKIENEDFNENNTYYYLRNGRMYELDNSTIDRDIISEEPITDFVDQNMVTYFKKINLTRGESIEGLYSEDGSLQTNGTCTSNSCTYYQIIDYYNEDGQIEIYDESKEYYYLVTRDTNILVLNKEMTGGWNNNGNYPFTLTSLHNQTKYNVTWHANTSIQCYADTRLENMQLYYGSRINDISNPPSSTNYAYGVMFGNFYNVKLGRGLTQYNNYPTLTTVIAGNGTSVGSNGNPKKYKFELESGIYNTISQSGTGITGTNTSVTYYLKNKSVFGNDYDKAAKDNTKLDIYYSTAGGWGGNLYASTNNRTSDEVSLDLVVKSGTFGSGKDSIAVDDRIATGIYVGGRYGGTHYSSRRAKIEGGYIFNLIGGPITGSTRSDVNDIYMYVTGGEIDMIIGGAGTSATYGNRIVSVTGGKINYSVFGGSNGYSGSSGDGTLNGTTYLYIGGNAQIGDETLINNDETLFGVESGSIFGNGNGNSSANTIGSCANSVIIIDDKANIKGNVYGGGNYGATGVSSSTSTSYTKININGGFIEGNVYGGGNKNGAGSTSKTASIDIIMNSGNVVGSIYGGSNEKGTIYGNTNINIYGGEITNSVYGGGRGGYDNTSNPGTFVQNDVKITIGDAEKETVPIIGTSIYGGSAYGTVNGTGASTNVSNDDITIIINKGIITNVFGGGQGNATYTPGVFGNISVTVNGGTITNVFGGNDQKGIPNGDIVVTINNGIITNVYGGGNETGANKTNVYLNDGTTTKIFGGSNNSGNVEESNVIAQGGSCDALYGGNNQGGTTGKTNVKIDGGNINTVYGGGEKTSVEQSTNIIINNNVGTVFGGSNTAGNIPLTIIDLNNGIIKNTYGGNNLGGQTTAANINQNGAFVSNLYGGGLKAETTEVNININYGYIESLYGGGNEAGAQTVNINLKNGVIDNLYGGSNTSGTVETSTIKTVESTPSDIDLTFTINSSNINSSSSTDHKSSETIKTKITNNTNKNITKWNLYIYPTSSKFDSNWSSAKINYENGKYIINEQNNYYGTNTLNTNSSFEFEFNVHSYVPFTDFKIEKAVFIGTDNEGNKYTKVYVNNLETTLSVGKLYGGNNLGGTTTNANITLNKGIVDVVFGGGNKAKTTNATTNITKTQIINGVYGGGNEAEVDNVTLNIKDSTIGTENNNAVCYGGGNAANVNNKTPLIIENTKIYGTVYGGGNAGEVLVPVITNINKTTITKDLYGGGNKASTDKTEITILNNSNIANVYAGGNEGEVKNGTNLKINDSTITESIFGGGNKATVTGNAIVEIKNTTANNIYGGGNAAGLRGNTNLKINGSTITNAIYGGGNGEDSLVEGDLTGEQNPAKIYGNTTLTIDKTTTIKAIYGGGNAAIVEGNTNLYINGSTIEMSVYAGGNGSTAGVYGNTNLDIDNNAQIGKHVFGGGNAAPTGRETTDSSKGIVNIVGANIGGNVYGGANTSKLYGETTVNIGYETSSNKDLIKSDIEIGGTVFGGGEANQFGNEEYDYSFISVTKGITININGLSHNNFNIKGSIFGSGNASSTTGYSNIYIKNYGSKNDVKSNISIQRADMVEINNSHIELKGATDRTNEYKAELFSLSRIDELKIVNNTSLYLQNGANLLLKFTSLDAEGNIAYANIENSVVERNTNNRLYLLEQKNLNIATDENALTYGEVVGMTFFGMYSRTKSGDVITALYSDFVITDNITGGDLYYFSSGSLVTGLHKTNHNIKVDGFYTNFVNEEGTGITIDYITPVPESASFYSWSIGEKVDFYTVELSASKYSTLGAKEIPLINHTNANTTFYILGVNFAGLEQDIEIVDYSEIPRIAPNTNDANSIFGLNMKSGQTGWITKGSTNFISENNSYNGTQNYLRENSGDAPSLIFYLYHSKNITEAKSLGTVVISLAAITPIDDLNDEVKRININVTLSTQLINKDEYEGTIQPGKQYEMFTTGTTNITNKSSFSTYYSLYVNSNKSPYKTGYHRSLVSTYLYPVNTEITMIDFHEASKPVYYYYIVNENDYEQQLLEFNQYGEVSYELSNFIKMGSTSQNNNYNDEIANQTYYKNNIAEEEFIFIVDFKDTNITEDILDKTLLIELRNEDKQTLISIISSEISTLKYSIYTNKDATIELSGSLKENVIYKGESTNINLDIKFTQEKLNSVPIFDTNYDDQKLGIKISIYDSNNNLLSNTSLMGINYIYNDNIYYPRYDGTTRINLAERVANLAPKLKLSTINSNLATGEYRIVIESFGSADGIYYGLESSDTLELNLTVIDNIYGLKISTLDKTMFINKETGYILNDNNAFPYTIEYSSGLSNPKLTIKLLRRKYDEIYAYDYELVDLKDYVIDTFNQYSTKEYLLSNTPSAKMDFYLHFKSNLLSGTYRIQITLYDGNNYIGDVYQYIIIK